MDTGVHIATSEEADTANTKAAANTNAGVQIVKAKRRIIRPTHLRDYV